MEARPPVLPGDRPAPALQGDRARTAYHGTTMGALALTGVSSFRVPFEPLTPGGVHVMNTNSFRHPLAKDEHAFMMLTTDAIEEAILFEGPETVAAVILEPVQNAGGCLAPPEGYFQRVREICDRYGDPAHLRRGHLRVRAPGHDVRRAALRLPARHDHERQGPHQRLLAARRGDLPRLPRRAVHRRRAATRSCTASPSAAIR